jgi:uncharacterized protein involved in exopolysaccharide biosynthesis
MMDKQEWETAQPWAILARDAWRGRWFIVAITLSATLAGAWHAWRSPKLWEASTVISPKKPAGQTGGVLSQLGGLGTMLSGQLGMVNTGLDRMAFNINTRELIGRVIDKENLLPLLYPGLWDAASHTWKGGVAPDAREAIDIVRDKVLRVSINPKKELITISVVLTDSAKVAPVVAAFLRELRETVISTVRRDADSNRAYLQEQLTYTSDPMLRDKIQGLITGEIEKAMLVGTSVYDLLEPPIPPLLKFGPDRKRILAMAFSSGLLSSILLSALYGRARLLLKRSQQQPAREPERIS